MQQSALVFAYGSNMDSQQMQKRCPESPLLPFIAEARGWALCFPRVSKKRKGGVGSIAAKDRHSVWGVVFSISQPDLERLDRFEGVPDSYQRKKVSVIDLKNTSHRVWTYIAIPQDPSRDFTPHPEYLALYIQGAKDYGLPESYLQELVKLQQNSKDTLSSAHLGSTKEE